MALQKMRTFVGHHRPELVGVEHSYKSEASGETFSLGPIDLSFTPGQLIFLIGGNGSGKTTLAKVILGLYSPERGEMRLDGEVIDEGTVLETPVVWRDSA